MSPITGMFPWGIPDNNSKLRTTNNVQKLDHVINSASNFTDAH